MTKGNGLALALLPLLHALLTGTARLLLNWRAWVAAVVIGGVAGPWYTLTYRMTANGFNYAWGWDFTQHSLPGYALGSLETLGVLGLIGFAAGLARIVGRAHAGAPDHAMAALAAMAMALFIFQVIAPSDIMMRYLVALVPAAMPVAATGFAAIARRLTAPAWLAGPAAAAALLGNAASIGQAPHVSPFGMPALARHILDDSAAGPSAGPSAGASAGASGNPLVLVSGSPRAEGALIAAFAEADPARTHTVLRASQMLADSNFMGSAYRTRFADAAALAEWLAASGIGWLVIETSDESMAFAHDRQLADVIAARPADLRQRIGTHEVLLYRLAATPPTPKQLRTLLERASPGAGLLAAAGS